MDALMLAGRIVFASMFVMSGINHFAKRRSMADYSRSMGVPAPQAAVIVSGVMVGAGGLMVALGAWGDLGALLIAAFLVPTALIMHRFWDVRDPQQAQQQQMHFMKNMVMAGGAVLTFGLFQCLGADMGFALTAPLFSIGF